MYSLKQRFSQAIGSEDECTTKFDGVAGAGLRRCTPGLADQLGAGPGWCSVVCRILGIGAR